jgi:hypothetical protein
MYNVSSPTSTWPLQYRTLQSVLYCPWGSLKLLKHLSNVIQVPNHFMVPCQSLCHCIPSSSLLTALPRLHFRNCFWRCLSCCLSHVHASLFPSALCGLALYACLCGGQDTGPHHQSFIFVCLGLLSIQLYTLICLSGCQSVFILCILLSWATCQQGPTSRRRSVGA